jgi:hypothetical protein
VRALRAIGELERIGASGMPVLVAAACGSRHQVAFAARRAIDNRIEVQNRDNAECLTALAEALAIATRNATSAETAVWAHRTAERLLRMAEIVPAGRRVGLVFHCEQVLDRTRDAIAAQAPAPEPMNAAKPAPTVPAAAPPQLTVCENPPSPDVLPTEPVAPIIAMESNPPATPDTPPGNSLRLAEPKELPWQPHWSRPGIGGSSADTPVPVTPPTPVPFGQLSDRDVLQFWLGHAAIPPFDGPLERIVRLTMLQQTLASRGFTGMRVDRVAALVSPTTAHRLQLIDALLVSSHSGASTWLLMLARDKSPQVRRAAILALITSRDRRILQLTHEMALHDRDPHVADLAPQIGKLLR